MNFKNRIKSVNFYKLKMVKSRILDLWSLPRGSPSATSTSLHPPFSLTPAAGPGQFFMSTKPIDMRHISANFPTTSIGLPRIYNIELYFVCVIKDNAK